MICPAKDLHVIIWKMKHPITVYSCFVSEWTTKQECVATRGDMSPHEDHSPAMNVSIDLLPRTQPNVKRCTHVAHCPRYSMRKTTLCCF